MSTIFSRIRLIIYFVIFSTYPEISFANYTVYFCKDNGRNIAQETPCKEGTLVRTTTIYNSDGGSNEEKLTEQLSNSNPIEHSSTPIVLTPEMTNTYRLPELLQVPNENEKQIRAAIMEAEERARIATEEAEERAKVASEEAEEQAQIAAEEAESKLRRERIRSANNSYFLSLLLVISGLLAYIIIKKKRGIPVTENQKYGVAVMITSFLLIVLVLMISIGWNPQLDFLENLMNSLYVLELPINIGDKYFTNYFYLIDLPSKYLVLGLLTTASYGLMTYLDITPPIRLWKKKL